MDIDDINDDDHEVLVRFTNSRNICLTVIRERCFHLHCVRIVEILSHTFLRNFRESNVFTNEVTT